MLKKLGILTAIAAGVLFFILTTRNSPVSASPGNSSSCLSCHPQSSSVNVTATTATTTLSPGQTFTVNISWSGGSAGNRLEINWPNVLSNNLFTPNPRVPYSSTAASGTTSSTLTAPATTGNYTIRVFAARGIPTRDSDYADIAVSVANANTAPVLAAIGNKSVVAGQNLQFVISATDANNNPLTYSATGLPSGATFNTTTRTFSWTPTTSQAGTYPNVTFQVSDGSLTDFEAITITVTAPNVAPVLAAIGNKSVVAGQNLQFVITATDANGNPLTYSATGLPSGATFNATTRTFSWTPTTSQAGTYPNVTFQVSDGSLTDFEAITITVTAPNAAPVLAAIGNKSVVTGQNLQFVISATDANGNPLTYSVTGLPSGATFNATTRTFSWTPTTSQAGSYPNVTFQVSDGSLTDFEAITITVTLPSAAPVLTAIGNKSVVAGQNLQFTIAATDANGDSLTYSTTGLPSGATFNTATRTFSWTPTTSQAGTYPNVTFQVSDGGLTDSETISITVAVGNAPPVLLPVGNKTAITGRLLQFTVSGTDPNNNTLTYSVSNLPAGANFNTTTRAFTWTPTQAGLFSGVIFNVSDGSLTANETISITVTANSSPVLNAIGAKTVTAGQPLQFSIYATDANSNPLVYSASGLPTGATFNASTMNFSWTPTTSQVGSYPNVTFQVTDGSLTATETVTISVTTANVAPVLTGIGNQSVTAGQNLQFTVSATDANNNPLTYSATGLPTGATFNASTMNFSWTPTTNQTGNYPNVTFQVTDGSLNASETITITVTASNGAPVLALIGNKVVIAGQLLQFTVTATDLNNDPLIYSATNLPSGANFASATGIFSWTPLASQIGPYSNVTFDVSDGTATDSEVITITVNSQAMAPVITPIGNKTVDVGQLLQFSVWATDANYDTLTYSASNFPTGAAFNSATNLFTWTPAPGQTGTYSGVSFQVSDGSLIATESITITVREINVAPVLNQIGNKTVAVGQTLVFNASATDSNNNQLAFSIFNSPEGANFSPASGAFEWTPMPEQVGTYPNITLRVSDGSLIDTESITITVTKSNMSPVLNAIGSKSVIAGENLTFAISATDPDKDQMTYAASGLPSGATFNPTTQTFAWKPTGNQTGNYPGIKFTASDGTEVVSESIIITVAPPDLNPPKLVATTVVAKVEPTSAVIKWTTDEPSTSQVEYWASPRVLSPIDTKLVTNHEVIITDLKPGTQYSYVTMSKDQAGNVVVSKENNFNTTPAVTYSDLKIEPIEAKVGEAVTISVVVTNHLNSVLSQVVPFRVGGALESTKTINLAPGEKKEISFSTIRWAIGLAQIDINDVKGFFTVRDLEVKKSNAFSPLSLSIIVLLIGLGAVGFWYYRRKTVKR